MEPVNSNSRSSSPRRFGGSISPSAVRSASSLLRRRRVRVDRNQPIEREKRPDPVDQARPLDFRFMRSRLGRRTSSSSTEGMASGRHRAHPAAMPRPPANDRRVVIESSGRLGRVSACPEPRGTPLLYLVERRRCRASVVRPASSRRRTRHAAFRSLLGIALVVKPTPYNMLITPEAKAFQR
jgi:hypothetical protein